MTFRHVTDIPARVDMTRPLMPKRDASDMGIYGMDVAWLCEVLSAWTCLGGYNGTGAVQMPEGPTAAFSNWIRDRASIVKGLYTQSGGRVFFAASVPSTHFAASERTDGRLEFGDVPDDVKVGDPVRREDVSGMFDWLQDVRAFSVMPYESGATVESYTTESGTAGSGTLPAPVASPTIYDYDWYYNKTDDSDEYGYWRRMVADGLSVSVTVSGATADMVESAALFLPVTVYTSDGQGDTAEWTYMPLSSPTFAETEDGVEVTASCSPTAIRDALGVVEQTYDGQTNGYYHCTIGTIHAGTIVPGVIAYIKFAADYRHPNI